MRTVLVCVRTPLAAQSIASSAARLGAGAVLTATSESEVMARLAEQPAELILVDTAVARPDPVAFTRRVLARVPRALLLLFGQEEPQVAAAVVAAGARGLIRSADQDPVVAVVKALLLIGTPRRPAAVPGTGARASAGPATSVRPGAGEPAVAGDAEPGGRPGGTGAGRPTGTAPATAGTAAGTGGGLTTPAAGATEAAGAGPGGVHLRGQPGIPAGGSGQATGSGAAAGAATAGSAASGRQVPSMVPFQRGDAAVDPSLVPARRVTLTERELQVLRGMADGKSNAEIGRDLYVSEDTVKTHARRLFRKLGVRDRAHAVAVGFRSGALA